MQPQITTLPLMSLASCDRAGGSGDRFTGIQPGKIVDVPAHHPPVLRCTKDGALLPVLACIIHEGWQVAGKRVQPHQKLIQIGIRS